MAKVAAMGVRKRRGASASLRLAAGLHDVSGDLAVGIALLKGWKETRRSGSLEQPDRVIEVFELVLAELRQLSRTASEGVHVRSRQESLRESFELEAKTTGVDIEVSITGKEEWLSGAQAELIRLTCREAIRNVKRHSGATYCRITVDLSSCPFVLTARDWGSGLQPHARRGGGIALLEALADEMGAALKISSQPGLGLELTLTGLLCVLTRRGDQPIRRRTRLRSVVADESRGSRKRVAPRRPVASLGQQIT
ncbi:MAG: sensor histidine kinase [Candidatus Dormibacteraceae bacterium]